MHIAPRKTHTAEVQGVSSALKPGFGWLWSLGVRLSAQLCMGWWEFCISVWAASQHDWTSKNPCQPNPGFRAHEIACRGEASMRECSIVMRKTRDSGFNHPWGGQKNPEGPSRGLCPRDGPEGFFGTWRMIEDRTQSSTLDNDILHQFKTAVLQGDHNIHNHP